MTIEDRVRSFTRFTRWNSTARFVAPVLIALGVMLCAAIASLEVLSTIRAYVGGESLYSKGQKNATYYLARYTITRSAEDYQLYETAIAYPLGDRTARLALQQTPVNLAAARAGFEAGGNDSADIPSIIDMFRLFGHVPLVHQAIVIWTEGDRYTLRIRDVAARMQEIVRTDAPPEAAAPLRHELQVINRELTPLSARFASTLGEAARWTRTILIVALSVSTLLTGLLCIHVTRARVRERDAKERGLTRMTELYAALSRASQLISRVADRGQLFDELCGICVATSGLSLAAVGLRDPDQLVTFVASHGLDARHREALSLGADASLSHQFNSAHWAVRLGRPQVCNDLRHESGDTFRSAASFPLRCNDAVVGVLSVFSEERHYFQRDIVELMEQLAMEASFALDSLEREATRRYQAVLLADQNRILNLIASGADLTVIFTTIAQFVETQSVGGLCALLSLDRKEARYSLAVAPSLPGPFGPAVLALPLDEDASPWTQAIQTRLPVNVTDLARVPMDATLSAPLRESAVHSVGAWPILGSHGQVLGAIALCGRRTNDPHHLLNSHFMGICTDLAGIAIESRRAADRIRHLAQHDELTGLPNRLLFNEYLPRALKRAERTGDAVGVLFLDLDRFKLINDTLGHGAGDLVLCEVAAHLRNCVRETDTLARLGGDEFTLLVECFKGPQDLVEIADKLLSAAARPLTINGQECHLSGSIGIAIYPKDGNDSASLLKNADLAMYRAKSSGRNNFQFYANDMNQHSIERLSLETQLRHAVERNEFIVHYQPKVNLQSGRIAGAEALVRWRHPTKGLLSPGVFIGVAEEAGIIGSIGRLVLESVCADARRWLGQGLVPMRIAVNLSAQQFSDSRLLVDLDRVLLHTQCDASSLEFEITESVVMTNPEKALLLLNQIKARNITLAIDDFGTGHSSLAYLKRFPVDSVKIDSAFVRDISTVHNDLAITKAIIALGHSMGLKVVAEGVETEVQLDILRRHRCDEFQGFLFSMPLPAAEFETLLRADAALLAPV